MNFVPSSRFIIAFPPFNDRRSLPPLFYRDSETFNGLRMVLHLLEIGIRNFWDYNWLQIMFFFSFKSSREKQCCVIEARTRYFMLSSGVERKRLVNLISGNRSLLYRTRIGSTVW